MINKVRTHGDKISAKLIEEIVYEEETHVAFGVKWVSKWSPMDPAALFQKIVRLYVPHGLPEPFSSEARTRSNMSPSWYTPLKQDRRLQVRSFSSRFRSVIKSPFVKSNKEVSKSIVDADAKELNTMTPLILPKLSKPFETPTEKISYSRVCMIRKEPLPYSEQMLDKGALLIFQGSRFSQRWYRLSHLIKNALDICFSKELERAYKSVPATSLLSCVVQGETLSVYIFIFVF